MTGIEMNSQYMNRFYMCQVRMYVLALFGVVVVLGSVGRGAAFLEPLPGEMTSISAVEMARRVRGGEITSAALIQAHLDRIHQLNGELHAIVTESSTAIEEAAEADRRFRRMDGNPIRHSGETAFFLLQ